MSFATFDDLFRRATGNPDPFPYQRHFAEADELPELVHAPTGAGKTATAVLGWLWRYFYSGKPTPRRLAYCLPMRVLVEQTRDEVKKWLGQLGLGEAVSVAVLMGGEKEGDWDLDPEKPAILIGTQDMLLSRALNRGYGTGRFRWPMHYGLLNNDCLWVLDEIQLMGTGLATSTQLQAFRDALGGYGSTRTVWMSATLLPRWLASVDFRHRIEPTLQLGVLRLGDEDREADGLKARWEAKKPIAPAPPDYDDPKAVAKFVAEQHREGSLTLVIVNTVNRCRKLFEELRNLNQRHAKGRSPQPTPDLKLIHSRFRPEERESWLVWLKKPSESPAGRIIVSTQVVEAGVDLSARTLITELAPWPSLVQRFGRCNRRGEFVAPDSAQVYWIDVPDEKAAPYEEAELAQARARLNGTTDVGLESLTKFFDALGEQERNALFPFDPPHVIRRKDFIDLFDTTADLAGNDIDVSRFIRDGDEIDVQVFWRKEPPPEEELAAKEAKRLAPSRRELCTVPVGEFRGFIEKVKKAGTIKRPAFVWDALDGRWRPVDPDAVFPGQVYWLPAAVGGYSTTLGWTGDANALPELDCISPQLPPGLVEGEGKDDDLTSESHAWQSIAEHTQEVVDALDAILSKLAFADLPLEALRLAARWHDWGKGHEVFQNKIKDDPADGFPRPAAFVEKRDVAKAEGPFWGAAKRQLGTRIVSVKHFRHELASALGVLTLLRSEQAPDGWTLDVARTNLALYLIAAHHGKVRMSIRSMPDERTPTIPGALFARGVWQDDKLPPVALGGGVTTPAVSALDLSPMLLGRVNSHPSWAESVLRLRDDLSIGPLRLAYLEALLRAADMRASKAADERAKGERR